MEEIGKKLITLENHNKIMYSKLKDSKYNGIECPRCKKELLDTEPNEILTCYPPKTKVHCNECGYKGLRVV